MGRRTTLAAALLAIACGARSSLDESEPATPLPGAAGSGGVESGSGGAGAAASAAGSGGTGAMAGSGGTGAMAGVAGAAGAECRDVVQPVVHELDRSAPAFVMSEGHRPVLAMLAGATPQQSFVHAVFTDWTTWPPDLTTYEAELEQPPLSFVLGDAGPNSYAFGAFVRSAESIDAIEINAGGGVYSSERIAGSTDRRPLLVQTRGIVFYVGYESLDRDAGLFRFTGRRNVSFSGRAVTGCATAPIDADVSTRRRGFVVGFTSSREFGACGDGGSYGPPTRVLVASEDLADTEPVLLADIDWGETIGQLELEWHSDGAWLVWQPVRDAAPGPIVVARVTHEGDLPMPPTAVVPVGSSFAPFATARLVDNLVIGWLDASTPGAPTFVIDLFDPNAADAPYREVRFAIGPEQQPVGPLALLGSRYTDQLLVAWEGTDGVFVTRIDCIGR